MAVLGRLLVSSSERLDLPDLLSLDSYAAGDWKYFLKGLVGDTKPFILKGFDVVDPINAIGTQSCSIRVADSVTFYPGSNAGSFFHGLQDGHAQAAPLVPELRKNAVNYVYLTFSTFNHSVDTRAFWDPDKDGQVGGEFTQDVNTQSVLQVQVNVSTGSFPANTIPVAKVTVGPVVITAIEDARDLMFRLGSGGINPNPFNEYAWRSLPSSPYARQEPPNQALAGGVNPFQGADKNILTLKEWMDAMMSEIRNIKGSAYWYSNGSTAIPDVNLTDLFNDAVASLATGRGKFMNTLGTLSWTSPVYLRSVIGPRTYIIPEQIVPMNDLQVAYISLERNIDFHTTNTFTFVAGLNQVNSSIPVINLAAGDWIKAIGDDDAQWRRIVSIAPFGGGSLITLSDNYANNRSGVKALKSSGSYTVQVADPENVPANGDTYWIAKRDDQGFAPVSITDISRVSNEVTVQLSAPVADLAIGQSVTISDVSSDTSFNAHATIKTITSPTEFTYDQTGPDSSVSGEGTLSAPAKIYLRWIGELSDGESGQFDDNIPAEVLQYIGSPSETATAPLYNSAPTGSLYLPNFNSIPGEDLTTRLAKVTAMLADKWQDDNLTFNPGVITFDGANISITGASLSIPGDLVGAAPVAINDISNVAIGDNEAIYVDISRTATTALTLSSPTLLDLLTPAQQRLILYRRIGSQIHIKPTSIYEQATAKIYEVQFVDPISTVLPTGASVLIDGIAGVNGDKVLFTNLSSNNNRVYQLSGVGTSIVWTALPIFAGGSVTPEQGAYVKVLKGAAYTNQFGIYDSTATEWSFNDLVRHFNSAGDYYEVSSLRSTTLAVNDSGSVFEIPSVASENLIVDYSLVRDLAKETGTIVITHNGISASASTHSSGIGSVGVTFTADLSGPDLRLRYTSDNSGVGPVMQYSVKRWSDLPGGPEGLPQYDAIQTLPTAVINTAYAMSNGSATEINCSAPYVFSGRTRVDLQFVYTPGLLPGTTSGDLEVYVDGKFIPRFVAGATVDAWYSEIDNNTIEFNRDYSPVAVSMEFRRKYGAIDISSTNTAKINALYDAIVGSPTQVADGIATHSSLQTAVNAVAAESTILVLKGTYSENVSITKNLTITGQGYSSEIDGNITLGFGCVYTTIDKLRFDQANLLSGADGNIINACYFVSAPADAGVGNQIAACVIL